MTATADALMAIFGFKRVEGKQMKTDRELLEWNHKDEWRLYGKDFLVTVTRHSVKPIDYYEGENRWAVYAYVYPKHPHFARFDGKGMWQEAAACMPLHGGPSFLRWHYDDDQNPCSVQVGADYHHLHDDFTHYKTKDDAYLVFRDAERLHDWLSMEDSQ